LGAGLHGTTIFAGFAERVVGAVEGGLSRRRAAKLFGVAVSTVIDWADAWRE